MAGKRKEKIIAIGEGNVFVVLGSPGRTANRVFGRPQPRFVSSVKLQAFAIASGKKKWESGASEDAKTREFLKSVDLAATPVYSGGYVYCPAVKRGSINDSYMLCFDAHDGRLAWKTFICAGYPLRVGYYHSAQNVVEAVLPLAVGLHAAFLLSPEDEKPLELLLSCPRPLSLALAERLLTMALLQGGVATAGLGNVWHSLLDTAGEKTIIAGLTLEAIERLVDRIERRLQESGEKEVSSAWVGDRAMEELRS